LKLAAGLVLVALLPVVHAAYAFDLATFAMRVGGPGSDDVWRSIEQASDGGYIIAGSTDSFGSGKNDAWIIKISEDGEIESQKTYGGKGGDTSRMVKQTPDGGYVVTGMTNSFSNGRSDVWVMKFSSAGVMEWHRAYGSSGHEMAHAIETTADGGYLVGGYTTSFGAQLKDYFVIKITSSGALEWAKRYGGAADDVIRVIEQISNGDYLIAGFTHSFGSAGDIMILRIEGDGDVVWQKRYGGAKFEEPSSILEVDGGYIIMEQSTSFSKNTDGWIFKIDGSGGIIWQKTLSGNSFDEISAARSTPDGGFIVAAETKSFGAVNEDFWVVKFNSEGVAQWQKRYGGAGIDEPEAIALTPEGGSFVVGTTRSFDSVGMDVWFLRLNADGDVLQCSSDVTANVVTNGKQAITSATPVTTTASAVAVTPLVKTGSPLSGKDSAANISFQCGVDIFNIPPVAADDSYMTDEDVMLDVDAPGVLANDTDLEGHELIAVIGIGPAHGTLDLQPDGSFTYTPEENYNGSDSFTYRANDGENSNEAIVTILVSPVNDNPVAADDRYATSEEELLAVSEVEGVLANDTDIDGDALSATLVSDVENGTLTLLADGSFEYSPDPDFEGTDSFTYNASDATSTSNTATVLISVGGANDPPVAIDDLYNVDEDGTLAVASLGILANDTDAENDSLSAILVDGPDSGSLTLLANGNFTYVPDPEFSGEDSFTYKANDGSVDSNAATVRITVEEVDDAPTALADFYKTDDDSPLVISGNGVLANDTDSDTDLSQLTAIETSDATAGFTLNSNGSLIFIPLDGMFDDFVFLYKVFDGVSESNEVEIRIRVEEQDS
jgi:VCBS repeat-containing protein